MQDLVVVDSNAVHHLFDHWVLLRCLVADAGTCPRVVVGIDKNNWVFAFCLSPFPEICHKLASVLLVDALCCSL